jgi:hypothetical protein
VAQEFELWNLLVEALDDWGLNGAQWFRELFLKTNKTRWVAVFQQDRLAVFDLRVPYLLMHAGLAMDQYTGQPCTKGRALFGTTST